MTWVAVVTRQVELAEGEATVEEETRGTAGSEGAEKEVRLSPSVEKARAEAAVGSVARVRESRTWRWRAWRRPRWRGRVRRMSAGRRR